MANVSETTTKSAPPVQKPRSTTKAKAPARTANRAKAVAPAKDRAAVSKPEKGKAPAGVLKGLGENFDAKKAGGNFKAKGTDDAREQAARTAGAGAAAPKDAQPGQVPLAERAQAVTDKIDDKSTQRFQDLLKQRFPGVDPKKMSEQFLKKNLNVHVIDFHSRNQGEVPADRNGDGKAEKKDGRSDVGSHGDDIARLYKGMGFKNVKRFDIKPNEAPADAMKRFAERGKLKPGDIVSSSLAVGDDKKLPSELNGALSNPETRKKLDSGVVGGLTGMDANERKDLQTFMDATSKIQDRGGFVIGAGSNSGAGTFNPATLRSDVITAPRDAKGNDLASASQHPGTTSGLGRFVFDQRPGGLGVMGSPEITHRQKLLSKGGPAAARQLDGKSPGEVPQLMDVAKSQFTSTSNMDSDTVKQYLTQMGSHRDNASGLSLRQGADGKLSYDPDGTRQAGDQPVSDVSGASEVPPAIANRLVKDVAQLLTR